MATIIITVRTIIVATITKVTKQATYLKREVEEEEKFKDILSIE